jgi:PPK2 family polyphosphate:nucleotide phosphotransferase
MSLSIQVAPKEKLKLSKITTGRPKGLTKEKGEARLAKVLAELDVIQEELYAAGTHSVLIVFQGMDTSGKDGAIRHVLAPVNPQGLRVESFKVPTPEELAHDFLWRAHKVTPAKGNITVFNRSYYEDVLVVRVHDLVPEKEWKGRYAQINAFEEILTASNTIVLKFYLHISKNEQEERLLAREQEAEKAWKLSVGDWKERNFWDAYQAAYEDALGKCSTAAAPWYIIPADSKWFRNLAIAECLVERLKPYRKQWMSRLEEMSKAGRLELETYRAEMAAGTK